MEGKNKDLYTDNKNSEKKFYLPVYEDIMAKFDDADSDLQALLMELIIMRALKDKNLKKKLDKTYDNRRLENGEIIHFVGYYSTDQLTEREADALICSNKTDISKIWVVEKYSKLAEMLK